MHLCHGNGLITINSSVLAPIKNVTGSTRVLADYHFLECDLKTQNLQGYCQMCSKPWRFWNASFLATFWVISVCDTWFPHIFMRSFRILRLLVISGSFSASFSCSVTKLLGVHVARSEAVSLTTRPHRRQNIAIRLFAIFFYDSLHNYTLETAHMQNLKFHSDFSAALTVAGVEKWKSALIVMFEVKNRKTKNAVVP